MLDSTNHNVILICVRTVCKGYLRNEFGFWKVHGIMNTSGLLQYSDFMLTFQETRSIYDYMNLPKIEFIAYILL